MIRLWISLFVLLFGNAVIFAQVPDLPKVPTVDPNKNTEAAEKAASKADAAAKAAEAAGSAEKAAAAQAASEKAKAAQESAEKAEAAQKSAEKAEAAQKAAEKAEVAQKAASKAETAQKAAEKAEVAQKAAEKAEVAQKAASKAEVAQKAAEKAEVAQKAAEKAEVAQKAASKAETAQKAAEKAEVAQKAAEKAEVALKAVSKAETAQKAAEKAEVAQKAAGKAESAQNAAEKATVAQNAAEKAEVAQKAAEKASGAQASAEKASAAAKSAEAASKAAQAISKIPEPVVPQVPKQPREPGTPKVITSQPPAPAAKTPESAPQAIRNAARLEKEIPIANSKTDSPQPIKKPNTTLAKPIAEDKAALSKAIGPITRPATGELSTGGDSGTPTESGSGLITASESGSAQAPAESNSKQASGASKNAPTDSPTLGESKTTDSEKKSGFWQRLFGGESKNESKTDPKTAGALSPPELQRKNEEAAPKPTRVATRIPGENSNPSPDSSAPDSDQDAQEMAVVPSGNGESDNTDPASKAGELHDLFGNSTSAAGPTPDPFAPENFGKPTRPREPGTIALPVSTSEGQSRPLDGRLGSESKKGGTESTLAPAGVQTAKPRASATPTSDQNSGGAATPPRDGTSNTIAESEASSRGTQVSEGDGSVRQVSDGTSNTIAITEGRSGGTQVSEGDGSVRQVSDGTSNTVIAGEEPPGTDASPLPSPEKKPGFFESLFGVAKKKDSVQNEKAPEGSPNASKSEAEPQAASKDAGGSKEDPKSGANPIEGTPTFKAANRDSEKKGGDRELKPGGASQKDSKKSEKDPTPIEIVQDAVKDRVRQELISAGVSPVAAERLAGQISTGNQEASETTKLIGSAAATLQLAGASQAQMDKALTEIANRRLTDASSGGTTDSIIGAEVAEAVTGRRLDPKLARPGEIARALLDAKAAVQLVGLDETKGEGKALIDQIFDGGLRGDKARDAIQKVIRPIVQEAEREQNSGSDSASSDAKAPAVDLPNQTDIGTGRGPAVVVTEVPTAPAPVAEEPAAKPKRDVSTAIDFSDIDPNSPTVSVVDSLVPGAPRPGSDQLPADKGTPPKGGEPKDTPPPADPDDKDKEKDSDGASPEASPTPPPKEEDEKAEGDTPAPEDDEAPKDGTPNPMNERGGNSLELAARTGGRLGGEQAKAQTRALDLILGGGGAGGPGNNPNSEGGSIILSPGEIAILSKTLSSRTVIKTVNGAVDPNPLEENSAAITERDLKELHLKGTGGAKGPTENAPAPAPQDPNSPLAGPGPIAPPQTGKTAVQSSAVKVQAADKIKVNVQDAQATGR